jgi:hypothetical protein
MKYTYAALLVLALIAIFAWWQWRGGYAKHANSDFTNRFDYVCDGSSWPQGCALSGDHALFVKRCDGDPRCTGFSETLDGKAAWLKSVPDKASQNSFAPAPTVNLFIKRKQPYAQN